MSARNEPEPVKSGPIFTILVAYLVWVIATSALAVFIFN
jgi:hypothetical protein